jgi:hypothetical protein
MLPPRKEVSVLGHDRNLCSQLPTSIWSRRASRRACRRTIRPTCYRTTRALA